MTRLLWSLRPGNAASWETDASSGGGVFSSVSVTLDAAAVRGLPTTPQTILAAPPAGTLYLPLLVAYHIAPWVADFASIDAAGTLQVSNGASSVLSQLLESTGAVTSLLAGGGPDGTWAFTLIRMNSASTTTAALSGYYDSDITAQALTISASNGGTGNYTLGTGSSLVVTVYYATITF